MDPDCLTNLMFLLISEKSVYFENCLGNSCVFVVVVVIVSVQVCASGCTLSVVGTNTLAGSCNTLLQTFHTLVNTFEVPIGKAVAMLSENPAR